MPCDYYAFGEILWDCLPTARHAGGAPFNVAVHLAQLGVSSGLISALGSDALGAELSALAAEKNVDQQFISRTPQLPTGTVQVTLDAAANATYEIVQPVAWDEIPVPAAAIAAGSQARALVFGSLALRSAQNQKQLAPLLQCAGPMKFFDVNLRAPFLDAALVLELAGQADVLKLNDEELAWLTVPDSARVWPAQGVRDPDSIRRACATLAENAGVRQVCVTRGAAGAAFWQAGELTLASAPSVTVRDTVGAGDAFTAALILGLTRGHPLPRTLETACRLGAYVASQPGATPDLPSELRAVFSGQARAGGTD